MGSYFTSLHVKCEQSTDLEARVKKLKFGPCYIKHAKNGWLSLYPEKTDDGSESSLRKFCAKVSKAFGAPCIAFAVYDGMVFVYHLARDGKIADSYNSYPGMDDDNSESDGPTAADIATLLPLCLPGTKESDLARLLSDWKGKRQRTPGEHIAAKLADYLGIPALNASVGFRYIDGSDEKSKFTEIVDAADVITVTANEKGWIKCPKCNYHFSTADKRTFNGKKHTSCGQFLTVLMPVQ